VIVDIKELNPREGESGNDAAGDEVDEAGGDVDYVQLVDIRESKGRNEIGGLRTGAELGGTTFPEFETVQPLGSPG
jgi:hypothetical protein